MLIFLYIIKFLNTATIKGVYNITKMDTTIIRADEGVHTIIIPRDEGVQSSIKREIKFKVQIENFA